MQPYTFRDGRAGKVWIAYENDIDGPFDSEADAQPTIDRLTKEAQREADTGKQDALALI